jgi:hypothetical protein
LSRGPLIDGSRARSAADQATRGPSTDPSEHQSECERAGDDGAPRAHRREWRQAGDLVGREDSDVRIPCRSLAPRPVGIERRIDGLAAQARSGPLDEVCDFGLERRRVG